MKCPLHVTPDELEAFRNAEAVIVREYESTDGKRTARVVAWGDMADMAEQAAEPGLFAVPVGWRIICQRAIPVKELLGQEAAA